MEGFQDSRKVNKCYFYDDVGTLDPNGNPMGAIGVVKSAIGPPMMTPDYERQARNSCVHANILTDNMIKSGIYSKSEASWFPGTCWIFCRILFGLAIITLPCLALTYFIFHEQFHLGNNRLQSGQVPGFRFSEDLSLDFPVRVQTKLGTIEGKTITALDREVNVFKGIPYAEPPLRELRFAKPKRIKPWSKVRLAHDDPPPCVQHPLHHRVKESPWVSKRKGSEDCLYLNIWTPAFATNGSKAVMVWFYGGAYISGSIDVPYYDGALLASFGDVVVVTVNYRVGVFGFLDLRTTDAPGNAGLHDQAEALRWVKENIAFFGGNPDLITLFGESAGAFSVGFHMVSPVSRDLFQRGILQSGSPFYPQVLEEPNAGLLRAQKFAEQAGCANDLLTVDDKPQVVVACLQRLDVDLLAQISDTLIDGFHPPFGVSVGNDFLPLNPYDAVNQGDIGPQKEIMIGSVTEEGSFFLYWTYPEIFDYKKPKNVTSVDAIDLVEKAFKRVPEPGPKLISHFFLNNFNTSDFGSIRKAIYEIFGDFIIVCPTVFFAEQMANQNLTVYHYSFSHRPVKSRWGQWMGVTHFDDVPFVFGHPFAAPQNYTDSERDLSARIMGTWTTFAKTGKAKAQKGVRWPKYTEEDRLYMDLSTKTPKVDVGPHEEKCNLWRFMFQTIAST